MLITGPEAPCRTCAPLGLHSSVPPRRPLVPLLSLTMSPSTLVPARLLTPAFSFSLLRARYLTPCLHFSSLLLLLLIRLLLSCSLSPLGSHRWIRRLACFCVWVSPACVCVRAFFLECLSLAAAWLPPKTLAGMSSEWSSPLSHPSTDVPVLGRGR